MLSDKIRPLISIITPTFNAAGTLEETLRSVEGQLDACTEHFLVDACSGDNTLEIARRFGWVKISSEPDRGIYDGMNKGAFLASGEWLLFLQADDWLPSGAMGAYRRAISKYPDAEMISGDAEAVKQVNGEWEAVWSVTDHEAKVLSIENVALGEPMINARLIKREVFLRHRGFSAEYSLAADRDFLFRVVKAGLEQREIPEMTYRYRWHAGSSTMTDGNLLTDRLLDENLAIARSHLCAVKEVDRNFLIRWHTSLTMQGAMNALEKGRHRLGDFAVAGFSKDCFWPALFFWEILKAVPGFLARGGRTRSQVRSTSAKK